MIRWLIGVPLGLVGGFATLVVLFDQIEHGWSRDSSLMGLVYASVFVGSILLVARREVGRRVLRGVSVAFAMFFGLLLVVWSPGLFPTRTQCLIGSATSLLIGVALSLRSVRTAMRDVREAQ